jgi:ubiquinone/menaquinone biosynthesis C-methylase UbiE
MASQKIEFSLELLARGFTSCTLFDYSQHLIHRARAKASECNVAMDLVLGDARDAGFLDESFDHIFIMGNSLGYIQEPDGDRRIIEEAYRLLRRGGWFLEALSALMEEAGFEKVDVRTGFSPHKCEDDYGFMNHRMLATGQKL